jgi:hypothetical protein
MRRRALLLVAVLLAAACANPVGPDDAVDDRARTRRELQEARQLWSRQGLTRYTAVMQRTCFCPVEITAPARVLVQGGVVASATRLDGTPADASRYLSVEQLFSLVEEAIPTASEIRVAYDASLGHPTTLYIDYVALAADEEQHYEVRDLTRQP